MKWMRGKLVAIVGSTDVGDRGKMSVLMNGRSRRYLSLIVAIITVAGAGSRVSSGPALAGGPAPLKLGWSRLLGGTGDDWTGYVATSRDGKSVFFAGQSVGPEFNGAPPVGGNDVVLARYDVTGKLLWVRRLGGTGTEFPEGIVIAPDRSIFLAGYTNSGSFEGVTNTRGQQAFVARFTPKGDLVWVKLLGGPGDEQASGIAISADGKRIVVAGSTNGAKFHRVPTNGGYDTWLAWFDPSGKRLRVRVLGGLDDEFPEAVGLAEDGSAYVVGESSKATPGQTPGASTGTALYLARYTKQGALAWNNTIDGDAYDWAAGVAARDGQVYIGGFTESTTLGGVKNHGSTDQFLASYKPSGKRSWLRLYGDAGADNAYSMTLDATGDVVLAGDKPSTKPQVGGGAKAFRVSRFSPTGGALDTFVMGGTAGIGVSMVFGAPDGSLYVTGQMYGGKFGGHPGLGGEDMFLVRLK